MNRNITHIIIEGCDGVGKDTIGYNLLKKYNRVGYCVYSRGELSAYAYCKKFGRTFIVNQHDLPFLYVLITKDKEEIKNQIKARKIVDPNDPTNTLEHELRKVDDQDIFIEAAEILKPYYNIITVDCTSLNIEESSQKVYDEIEKFIANIPHDKELNTFNQMYVKACEKLGQQWYCIDNQPYLNGKMIMTDAQYNHGVFETFEDKTYPDNLIYSIGYTNTKTISYEEFMKKPYDFAYPINSKINYRPELKKYMTEITKDHLLYTLNSQHVPVNDNTVTFNKAFVDDYIKEISKAKATVYVSREIAYLRMLTARCYEAALANQIMFVDRETDPDCSLLHQIYGEDNRIISLLYIDENELMSAYERVIKDKKLVEYILVKQHEWYDGLRAFCFDMYGAVENV